MILFERGILAEQSAPVAQLSNFERLTGITRPAVLQPLWDSMLPVPLIKRLSTTRTKQELPLLDLFTAPLKVTLAWGK